jgi:hypothetical protein
MFRFSLLRSCPSSSSANVASAVSGKWSESVAGVPAPAPPGSNPFSMQELKVPTSALRIKNRLAIDMSANSKNARRPRQPVQLQPGPKITPPLLPNPISSMRTLEHAIDATRDDAARAQSGIHRLWEIQSENDQELLSSSTNSSSSSADKNKNKLIHQQSVLDTDSFCPEDSVNNTVHSSLSCQALFSGLVVEVSSSESEQQSSSFVMLVREPDDESKGILLHVFQPSSKNGGKVHSSNNNNLVGSNVVVSGSLRMKRIAYRVDSEDDETVELPGHHTIPFVQATKPILVIGRALEEVKVSELLSKVTII